MLVYKNIKKAESHDLRNLRCKAKYQLTLITLELNSNRKHKSTDHGLISYSKDAYYHCDILTHNHFNLIKVCSSQTVDSVDQDCMALFFLPANSLTCWVNQDRRDQQVSASQRSQMYFLDWKDYI